MILQSLNEYYNLQVAAAHPDYALAGTELKRIHFVLVLSGDGMLVDIEQPKDKICVAKSRQRGGKDAQLIANRMWDSVAYVTGHSGAHIQHRSFTELVGELHRTHPENSTFAAVQQFYARYTHQLHAHPMWQVITAKIGHNLSFRLISEDKLAAQQQELLTCENSDAYGECMVTGRHTAISRLHPKIYLHGGAPTGTKLVSFTKGSGYDSYYKKDGGNAPISVEITENYAAALTGLLQQGSDNCVVVGDVSFVFYTLPGSSFNKLFRTLIDPSIKTGRAEALEQLKGPENDNEFVLMALVPNAARISLRLFLRTTVKKAAGNIVLFYNDIELEHNFISTGIVSILTPLFIASPHENIDKLPPQLIIDYIAAIVGGKSLPIALQNALLDRNRKQRETTLGICSMLRCIINRNNSNNYITMALDKSNQNCGYLLGRMFAILERSQELASPGITFTLRDTYYTTASVTPAAVFNRLVELSNSFFRRIPTQGTAIYMKAQLGEVTEKLDSKGIPVRLSLDDQSRFALGYFHQRQIYFTKKVKEDEQTN